MNGTILALIGSTVILNTYAQIALKMGMKQIGNFDFVLANFWLIVEKVVFSPWILSGLTVYVFSVILWLLVLSRAEVSVAYPISSLGYVTSLIAAYYFCGESLSVTKMLGIGIIILGVFLVARN